MIGQHLGALTQLANDWSVRGPKLLKQIASEDDTTQRLAVLNSDRSYAVDSKGSIFRVVDGAA